MSMEQILELAEMELCNKMVHYDDKITELKQRLAKDKDNDLLAAWLENAKLERNIISENYLDIDQTRVVEHKVNVFKTLSDEEQWYELGTLMLQINGID